MTERLRYRRTDRELDVGFCFGAIAATHLAGPVLIRLLGALHLSESAARNTLAAMVHRGSLLARREGRVAVYELAPAVLEKYRQVERTAPVRTWTGEFRTVIYRAPERTRAFRDRLQYVAEYCGLGMLRPGVLIGTRDVRASVTAWLGEAPEGVVLHHGSLRPDDLDEARAMARQAWALDALRRDYARVLTALDRAAETPLPAGGAEEQWELLRQWNRLYREVIELQIRDPDLPRELLPRTWPRDDYVERLGRLDASWGPVLSRFLREATREADPGALSQLYDRQWA